MSDTSASETPEASDKPEASLPVTSINFQGLDGNPIEGLKVRLTVNGQVQEHITDAEGCTPPLRVVPGTQVDIDVQRMDGSCKRIDKDLTSSNDSTWTLTSPAYVLEAATELHQGPPGDAETGIPVWAPSDMGVLEDVGPPVSDAYRDEGRNHPAPKQEKPAKPKQAQTRKLPDPARATPIKTGAHAPLQNGRDANGNPLLVYMDKIKDWWGSWKFPWTHTESSATKTAPKVIYSGGMEDKVKALIETATELTTHEISGSTQTYLTQARTGQKKLSEYEAKELNTSKGWCYKYVKIALVQAHVVDDVLAGESASGAGLELEKRGFKEVTQDLPDARWAAAGDVIVYRWTEKNWEAKKKADPTKPNHGHIDIRSYEAYISDFIPGLKYPNWTNYTNIRIYRKAFDSLPIARMRAFLHCLRDYECQEEPDGPKRYQMLNTPLPSNPGAKLFSDTKVHPWLGVKLPLIIQQKKGSTGAGAYQITLDTWKDAVNNGWSSPSDEKDLFSPAIQDRIAVITMEQTKGALSLVRVGKIEEAVEALTGRWSSLPGGIGNAGRRSEDGRAMDMTYFMAIFSSYLVQEKTRESLQ